MRKRCLNAVYELAQQNEMVAFVGSDLSPGLLAEMEKAYPERFFMEGIAEANIVGLAAGLALEGFIPYVNTIATFITRRCYEQVAIDVCLHDLPVRLIGNGGGYVYAPLGPTHQAIEDIAIMRALPNMTVTAACDADEMDRLMQASLTWHHPMYIRLAKGGDQIISNPDIGFEIGKAVDMIGAVTGKSEVLFISTGVATTQATLSAQTLNNCGIQTRVLHFHTIKPLDIATLASAVEQTSHVITVEEHSLIGGLGSAVLEALVDARIPLPARMVRLGIPDKFAGNYGSQLELMKHIGIDAESLTNQAMDLMQDR